MSNAFLKKQSDAVLIPAIDAYLIRESKKDADRAPDVISPSQLARCMRAQYFSWKGYETDSGFTEPRSTRIFENGDHVHLRLQKYLFGTGLLLMDEVPLRNDSLNLQGHTDGIMQSDSLTAIVELKSINDRGFSYLQEPLDDHTTQGGAYVYCVEKERQYLQDHYSSAGDIEKNWMKNEAERVQKNYDHIVAGRKFSREQKLEHILNQYLELALILIDCDDPIDTVVFLYENKNDQNLKEFAVRYNKKQMGRIEERCREILKMQKSGKIPDRSFTQKSRYPCSYCDYKLRCWGK